MLPDCEHFKSPQTDLILFPTVLAAVDGQVPRELRGSPKWPMVEWFRPVYLFPRGLVKAIDVKWTSAVTWRTADERRFRTDINFWSTGRLRRTLRGWGYPMM